MKQSIVVSSIVMENIIYVFQMGKVISYDQYGFPSREICIYFTWKAIYEDLPSKMAVAFETSDTILTKEQAEHINFRQVEINNQHVSKFKRNFNLTATLALLMWKTWVPGVKGNHEIIEPGFKHGHGEYDIFSS